MKQLPNVKQRLKNQRGESLTELLSSTMIIMLAVTILAGAVVSTGIANSHAKSSGDDILVNRENEKVVEPTDESNPFQVIVTFSSGEEQIQQKIPVTLYKEGDQDGRSLYYYRLPDD